MLRIERYLFRTAATAFLAGLLTLTAVIWVTQALKQLDLMTGKGQTILVFLTMTGLGLPFLTAIIAPVALFASVLYCLNKLNGDSELVVMSASGVSTARLLRPFLALFALVFMGCTNPFNRTAGEPCKGDPMPLPLNATHDDEHTARRSSATDHRTGAPAAHAEASVRHEAATRH